MTEPQTTTATAAAAGVAALAGSLMGVTYDTIFWSLLGALAGLRFAPQMEGWLKVGLSVASSAVIGCMTAPLAAAFALQWLPPLGTGYSLEALRPWVAGPAAAFAPVLIPKALDALAGFFTRLAGGPPKP